MINEPETMTHASAGRLKRHRGDDCGVLGSAYCPRIIIRRIKVRDPHFTRGWIFVTFLERISSSTG